MLLLGRMARKAATAASADQSKNGPFSAETPKPAQRFSLLRRRGNWKDALRRRFLAGADLLAVLAGAGALALVQDPLPALAAIGLLPLWIVLAKLHGLYDRDHARIRHPTLDELSSLFHWVTLSVGLTALALALAPDLSMTPLGAAALWSTVLAAALVLRSGARTLWRRVVPPDAGLVIGDGPLALAVRRKLELARGHHVELVDAAQLSSNGSAANGHSANGHSTSGRPAHAAALEQLIQSRGISRVVLAENDLDERTLATVVSACRSQGARLSVAPPLQAMLGTAVNLNHLAELPLVEFRTWDPSRSTMLIKRAIDLTGSLLALFAVAPVMAVVAIAIKLDSRGPALFFQVRAGREGVPFRMLKFRTMVADAEERLHELVSFEDLPEPSFKLRSDPRVTRVGRFLRRFSLDELPQLFNVIRGDMSLVGPRPEEVDLVQRYSEPERFRLSVRPGLTGPMQVHGRAELTFSERLAVEREYIENYSLRKDIKILGETVAAVISRQGAF